MTTAERDAMIARMQALLGYRPSLDQIDTVTMLADGKGPRDLAERLFPRDMHSRGSYSLTRGWVAKVCKDLRFGESEPDCERQGWAAMCTKASALMQGPGQFHYDYATGTWVEPETAP